MPCTMRTAKRGQTWFGVRSALPRPRGSPDQGGPPSPEDPAAGLAERASVTLLPGIRRVGVSTTIWRQSPMNYMALCRVTDTETGESWEVELADVRA